ncbi:uncharacterized protein LODBEIA_P28730 [Lodderomyces beijingensis]|uniref:DUF159-domain-containing protein n=1 Tax=Lodderomyces beijingensis TaxID=1775926 RepID=A0ABP0ZKG4_9ASCO
MCGRFAQGISLDEVPAVFNTTVYEDANAGGSETMMEVHNRVYQINLQEDEDAGGGNGGGRGKVIELDMTRMEDYVPSYNVAVTNTAMMVYMTRPADGIDAKYVFEKSKFGLVPTWEKPKDPTPVNEGKANQGKVYSKELGRIESRLFNCRKESLEEGKRIWSSVKNERCVIPIQGYFEWHKSNTKTKNEKLPYFVHSKEAPLLFLAGFYSHNVHFENDYNVDNKYLSSFTIVTGPAKKSDEYDGGLADLHPRKPIFIEPSSQAWFDWLDPDRKWDNSLIAKSLNCSKNPAWRNIEAYRVAKEVGNPSNKSKDVLKKINPKKSSIDGFFSSPSKKRGSNNEGDEIGEKKKVKLEGAGDDDGEGELEPPSKRTRHGDHHLRSSGPQVKNEDE